MEKIYEIVDILHNGRKGIRYKRVRHKKYTGLVGTHAIIDTDKMKQFKPFRFDLIDHFIYQWWEISEVLEARIDDDGTLVIETVNSIYVFKEVKNEN